MKKTSTLIAVLVLLFCGVSRMQAGAISPSQAKEVVSHMTAKKIAPEALTASVVFDATNKDGQPYIYAVSRADQKGYVLVSGDDRFTSVLGYSSQPFFNEQEMPENKRAWLQGYIDEMKYLESINYQPTLRSTSSEKAPIEPLIETKWGQNTPYNDYCPVDGEKHSLTGCVATAMAQLINYHIQHYDAPKTTIAEIEGYISKDRQLKVDTIPAGTAIPDKSLLVNIYDNNATDAQKDAVAKLMLYCGTSVRMNYRASSSSGSSSDVPEALISKFGFDSTTHMISRADYTYAEWMDIVYDELAAARPVYHRGASSGGGHAFLVDGYDGKGLFHINWGWTGNDNDYYALSVLNPDDNGQSGASNSSDGYTISQRIIIGTQINTGETWHEPVYLTTGNLRIDGQDVIFEAFNWTGETHDFDIGIGMVGADGSLTVIGNYYSYSNLEPDHGWANLRRSVPTDLELANMTQKIVPMSREKNTEQWQTSSNPNIVYFLAEYDAEGVPHLSIHPVTDITAGEITIPTSKFITDVQKVKSLITNNGDEFYGTLYLFASTDETKGDYTTTLGVTLLQDSTQEVTFEWYPDTIGTYNLWIASDKNGEEVLSTTSVTITKDPAFIGKTIAILAFSFDGLDSNSEQIDPETGVRTYDVYSDSIKGQVYVGNLTEDTITLSFGILFDEYDETTGTYIRDTYTKTYKNRTFTPRSYKTFNITPREKEIGKTYRMRMYRSDTNPKEDLDTHFIFHLRANPEPPVPTGIDKSIQHSVVSIQKVLQNGQLYIMYEGRMYDVMGRMIKGYRL